MYSNVIDMIYGYGMGTYYVSGYLLKNVRKVEAKKIYPIAKSTFLTPYIIGLILN